MCATAILLLLFPRSIATHYGCLDIAENRDVLALAVSFLHVAVAWQLTRRPASDGSHEPARLKRRARADVAGGRASYWPGRPRPMCALLGFGLGLQGFGIWLGLAFGLFMAAGLLTTRFVLLSKRPVMVQ